MHMFYLFCALAVTATLGCGSEGGGLFDEPVAELDSGEQAFSKLIVPGACAVSDDIAALDVSILLLDGRSAMRPNDRLRGQALTLGASLSVDDFVFTSPSDSPGGVDEVAFFTGEIDGARIQGGVDLQNLDLAYLYPGGEARQDDARLVVLLLDQSGSLKGINPISRNLEIVKASDYHGQRFDFFQMLVSALPPEDYVSLVWFKDRLPTMHPELAMPTLNRDAITDGIGGLAGEVGGFTPLADALSDTLTRVVGTNPDLNPVVVLFTDGVEGGDTSMSGKTLAQVTDEFVAHTGGAVPVIVLQLQPSALSDHPRGRDPALVDLACRTGGEHLFIEDADEFTASDVLQDIVRNRISGIWRLRVAPTFSAGGPRPDAAYWLSTELRVTLAGRERPYRLGLSKDGFDYNDSRLWLPHERLRTRP